MAPIANAQTQVPISENSNVRDPPPFRKRTTFYPPGVERSVISGSWSIDWMNDHNLAEAGVIICSKKKMKEKVEQGDGNGNVSGNFMNNKKAGALLRHNVPSLKKVARLPSKDRRGGFKIIKEASSEIEWEG